MNFRFLFGCILSLTLLGGTMAQAQTRVAPRKPGGVAPKARLVSKGAGLKDGLTMKDGRIVLTELGITNPITADKKLVNGTVISPTGLVTAKDSSTIQMAEGDLVSLTGRVTTRRSIVEADSLLKIKTFDLRYPGKRKKMEEEAERKAKVKTKLAEDKAKAAEKRAKANARR
ncbi:hypothetical protein I2I05_01910 [Hymenobacter sp. BT683]|uniref:DUF6799 domain-containing protein n=1 Tax=Hymenobacter jeongseonensis TaxID=2791027 RepID=A0ABS0ICQ5_9BACT|nr:DUF6799 domain-containing protein [Hymenobacter jeongseonensis]MBF9236139.1 hypothetical protein [Hymenobacter jeongseonensis]